MNWIDVLIAAAIALGAIKGLRSGLIMELAGLLGLLIALAVPWAYNGSFDAPAARLLHTGSANAHLIVMALLGIASYLAVLFAARIFSAFARLPFIGFGNALGGAGFGAIKTVIAVWIMLYVGLFLPLSPQVRFDLHRSAFVQVFGHANDRIDGMLTATLPPFLRPVLQPLLDRHRV